GLGRFAAYVPLSVLAGILISVGLSIMDVRGLRQLKHVPRADAAVLVMVLVVTVFFDLIQAVALGVALASMLFMKRMGDEGARRSRVGAIDEFVGEPAHPEEVALFGRHANKVMVKHLHGPLHFGFTSSLQDMAAKLPFTPYVVVRMVDVPFIDQSGLNALMELVADLEARGSAVFITELQEQPREVLAGVGLAPGHLPAGRVLPELADVLFSITTRERAAA
ncbi:MAG: STAS domain-containing protein, partial [Vicinamibacterales bacterium]